MDLDPVDLGRELRQRVQSRGAPAPVVVGRPVAGELPQRRQLHTLGPILDQLPGGPAGRGDTLLKVVQCLLRDVDAEGADGAVLARDAWLGGTWAGRRALRHCRSPSSEKWLTD